MTTIGQNVHSRAAQGASVDPMLYFNMRILLIQNHERDVVWWRAAFAPSDGDGLSTFTQIPTLEEAIEFLSGHAVDLVLIDVESGDDAQLYKVQALRHRFPKVPVITIIPQPDDQLALKVLQLGADDCIVRKEALDPVLLRAAQHAIGRAQYQNQLDDKHAGTTHDFELGRLTELCGPAPLPVTERSFGVRPLRLEMREDFETLADSYIKLLNLALESRATKQKDSPDHLLDDLAEKLGVLNAGPRDVIELHKAAMLRAIEGQTVGKVRAMVEEGRLIMLQLMGRLVTIYRTMSWGNIGQGSVSRAKLNKDRTSSFNKKQDK